MRRTCAIALVALVALAVLTVPVLAAAAPQVQPPVATPTPTPAPAAQGMSDEDLDLQTVLSEPDFTLGVLPTTFRLPKHKMAFRITHRFTYKINGQGVGEFFENFFGFDSSATSGFELRFGVANGTQVLVLRRG